MTFKLLILKGKYSLFTFVLFFIVNISSAFFSFANAEDSTEQIYPIVLYDKLSNEKFDTNTSEDKEGLLQNSILAKEKIITKTAFSLIGEPKYGENFQHFDYVNPNAPKGGMLKLAQVGSYDNFNRFASRGAPERNSYLIYDSLFKHSLDEIASYYPLLATSITYSDSYQWAEVTLNPKAVFYDGVPITAEDVAFTFEKLMTQGVPQYRVYYQGVTVTAIAPDRVRFELPEPNREHLLTFVGDFIVLPKHFWSDKNLADPLTTPPLGSGAYYISDYQLGQYVVYQRNDNYWAKDLPVNKGLYNFDKQQIEYYMDDSIALEAFKAGEYDFRIEGQPKNWFTQYQGGNFDRGFIIKSQEAFHGAPETIWLAFNITRPIFQDRKVREALTLAFDFNWFNQVYYYNSYHQPISFFANTPYAATGKPSEQELALLTPLQNIIPEKAFGEAYLLPQGEIDGFNRSRLLQAKELLSEAGWHIKDGQLVNQETAQPFEFELLTYISSDSRYLIPFQQHLAKLGIKMTINAVDYPQLNRRLRQRDYDMIPTRYSAVDYPTSSLKILWGSDYLNSSWNSSGLHNDAIDYLIAQIEKYSDDPAMLLNIAHALDRILTYEYPMIPMWYPSQVYSSYWNKFAQPKTKPLYSFGINTWWFDVNKAQAITSSKNSQR